MAITPIIPDVPGRGAWTLKGGLLPLKPGGKAPGYYRLADSTKNEVAVGSSFASGKDKSDSARSVNLAVKAFQRLCGIAFPDQDGWLGPQTANAGIDLQRRLGIEDDGIFGPKTFRTAIGMLLATKADAYAVPRQIVTGIVGHESEWDFGAVGVSGWDHGICQINLDPKNGNGAAVSVEQALDPSFALEWTAKDLRRVFNLTYTMKRGISLDLAWNVAILNHNSPKNAVFLRDNGTYPTDQARQYVEAVRAYV